METFYGIQLNFLSSEHENFVDSKVDEFEESQLSCNLSGSNPEVSRSFPLTGTFFCFKGSQLAKKRVEIRRHELIEVISWITPISVKNLFHSRWVLNAENNTTFSSWLNDIIMT